MLRKLIMLVGFTCVLFLLWITLVSNNGITQQDEQIVISKACIENLRRIDVAKREYAAYKAMTNGTPVSASELVQAGFLRTFLFCPLVRDHVTNAADAMQTSYEVGPVAASPRCKLDPDAHGLVGPGL